VNERPVGEESTHHAPLVGSVWTEPELAHGSREQHFSLRLDYSRSSVPFSSGLASMVNGFARVLQKAKYRRGQDGADLLGVLLRAS